MQRIKQVFYRYGRFFSILNFGLLFVVNFIKFIFSKQMPKPQKKSIIMNYQIFQAKEQTNNDIPVT